MRARLLAHHELGHVLRMSTTCACVEWPDHSISSQYLYELDFEKDQTNQELLELFKDLLESTTVQESF